MKHRFIRFLSIARPALLLLSAGFLGFTASAHAIDEIDTPDFERGPYAGLSAGMLFVDAGGEKFSPAVLQADFGYRISELLTTELTAGAGVYDDDSDDAEMSVEFAGGAHMFVGGAFSGRTSIALGLGYTFYELDTQAGASGEPGSQDYRGPSLQFRLEERLKSMPSVILRGGYQHVFLDGDVTIKAAILGAVYEF
ncbi:outer membrane beta-barrel protein [Allohahella marinimesophila]|uniref:Outer membrane protein beta-barrel domain-containing protein n=1 Tax=Allohahella marinimesophila TaxID=1054972 RepID=A0ABP7NPA8_9GAMM